MDKDTFVISELLTFNLLFLPVIAARYLAKKLTVV